MGLQTERHETALGFSSYKKVAKSKILECNKVPNFITQIIDFCKTCYKNSFFKSKSKTKSSALLRLQPNKIGSGSSRLDYEVVLLLYVKLKKKISPPVFWFLKI